MLSKENANNLILFFRITFKKILSKKVVNKYNFPFLKHSRFLIFDSKRGLFVSEKVSKIKNQILEG